jgi:hypothetical protein
MALSAAFITFPPTMLMPNDLFSTRSSVTSRSWPHDASSVYVFFNDRIAAIVVFHASCAKCVEKAENEVKPRSQRSAEV